MELLGGRVTGPRGALSLIMTTLINLRLRTGPEQEEATLAAEAPQLLSREVPVEDKYPSSNLTSSSRSMTIISLIPKKKRSIRCPCSRVKLKYLANTTAGHQHDPELSRKQLSLMTRRMLSWPLGGHASSSKTHQQRTSNLNQSSMR